MSGDPLKDRFEGVDGDGDGVIDEAEFGRLLDALGAGYSDAQIRAAFNGVDCDNSGTIDLEEFRKWWTTN